MRRRGLIRKQETNFQNFQNQGEKERKVKRNIFKKNHKERQLPMGKQKERGNKRKINDRKLIWLVKQRKKSRLNKDKIKDRLIEDINKQGSLKVLWGTAALSTISK